MVCKFAAVCLFLGLVLADPVPEKSFHSANEFSFISNLVDTESTEDQAVASIEFDPTVIFDILGRIIDFKSRALQIAVNVIHWLVSNSIVIVIGILVTFGFCKLTDKCNFDYEQYMPANSLAQFKSLTTPERLDQAEQFFVTAVEKYAEKRKRSVL